MVKRLQDHFDIHRWLLYGLCVWFVTASRAVMLSCGLRQKIFERSVGVQVRQYGFATLIKKDVTEPSIPRAIDYLFLSICLSDKMLSPLHSGLWHPYMANL